MQCSDEHFLRFDSNTVRKQTRGSNPLSAIRSFFSGFGLLITYELIEEALEEVIAWGITTVIAKISSFLIVVVLTQATKYGVQGLAKILVIALKPVVKKYTYREGNDKSEKILRFIKMCKEKINDNKFLIWLKNNPKSISGIIGGFLASLSGGALTASGLYFGGVQLPLWSEIVLGVVAFGALFALTVLGVTGAGFETPIAKMLRMLAKQLGFSQAVDALDKVNKEIEAEAIAKAESEAKAKEEAEAKYRASWQVAITNRTFKGSFEEFVTMKEEEEAEAQAKAEEALKAQAREAAYGDFINAVNNSNYLGSFEKWLEEHNI